MSASDASTSGHRVILKTSLVCVRSAKVLTGIVQDKLPRSKAQFRLKRRTLSGSSLELSFIAAVSSFFSEAGKSFLLAWAASTSSTRVTLEQIIEASRFEFGGIPVVISANFRNSLGFSIGMSKFSGSLLRHPNLLICSLKYRY